MARTDRMDHDPERQFAGGGGYGGTRGEGAALCHQLIGFALQIRTRRARDDPRHPAGVRKVAVRSVDDDVDRLFEEVAANYLEGAAGRYFFLREDFRRLGTFPPARRASERPMAIACLRLFTRRPERPLFNVPRLRLCIARLTFDRAFLPYLAIWIYSTFALALSPRTNSSTLCCVSCCWMRGFTSARPGKRTGRTSSS